MGSRRRSWNSAAVASTWARRSGGMSTCSRGSSTRPVSASSMRSSSCRMMRNVEGTTPLAAPEWTPSREDVDAQRAGREAAQRGGDPHSFVVETAGVEADHEARAADAVAQLLDVRGQVGAAALLGRFDEHDAPRVGEPGELRRLDGEQRGERGVAVVGAASAVQPVALEHRLPRAEVLAPTRPSPAACRSGRRAARCRPRDGVLRRADAPAPRRGSAECGRGVRAPRR